MSLPGYLRLLRRRWFVVVLGTVVGIAVAGASVLLVPSRYAATTALYVSAQPAGSDPSVSGYEGSLLAQARVKSYLPLVRTDAIAQQVVDDLGLKVSAADLKERITATSQDDTALLFVTVTDSTPQGAALLANATGDAFIRYATRLEQAGGGDPARPGTVTTRVATPAVPPSSPAPPGPALLWSSGAILGLVLGIVAALTRESLDTAVRDRTKVETATRSSLVGWLERDPSIARSPNRLVEWPQSPTAEQLQRLCAQLRFGGARHARVIACVSSSTGEGTTTVVCNLAVALAQTGSRVLVVDANLRRPRLGPHFGLDDSLGLADVIGGKVRWQDAVHSWTGHTAALDVLTSGPPVNNPNQVLVSDRFDSVLREARAQYDLVLIDTAPLLRVAEGAVVAARADGVLLMVRYGKTSQADLASAAATVNAVRARLLGCVLTMAPRASTEDLSTSPRGIAIVEPSSNGHPVEHGSIPEHGFDATRYGAGLPAEGTPAGPEPDAPHRDRPVDSPS